MLDEQATRLDAERRINDLNVTAVAVAAVMTEDGGKDMQKLHRRLDQIANGQ